MCNWLKRHSSYKTDGVLLIYSLRPKLYDVLVISHVLRNVINIVWGREIMICFTKLSLINGMEKINEIIERRESN